MGMVGLVRPGCCDHPGAVQPAHKAVSEGRLMDGMRRLTVLERQGPGFGEPLSGVGGGAKWKWPVGQMDEPGVVRADDRYAGLRTDICRGHTRAGKWVKSGSVVTW